MYKVGRKIIETNYKSAQGTQSYKLSTSIKNWSRKKGKRGEKSYEMKAIP
jgi:hypothetical protein